MTTRWHSSLRSLIRPRRVGILHRRLFHATSSPQSVLHTEWIGRPSLDSQPLTGTVLVFLHGLLGNSRNVKTLAQKTCALYTSPGLLVDLRGHGRSKECHEYGSGTVTDRVPVTLDDCVGDIQETLQHVGVSQSTNGKLTSTTNITFVGHSLGGRVAMQYVHARLEPRPSHVWLLDTVPGLANTKVESVIRIAELVREEKSAWTRPNLQRALTESHGLDTATAQWLASSYDPSKHDFGFDLTVAHNLVQSMDEQDFLGFLQEAVHEHWCKIDLVRGGQNADWHAYPHTISLLQAMAKEHAGTFGYHTLPKAGHWVHIDDLPGLLNAMRSRLL
jgi:esterase